jgi:hypothetical protein
MGPPQRRSEALQKDDLGVYVLLLILRKMDPPRLELVGVFDLPFHRGNITQEEYRCQEGKAGRLAQSEPSSAIHVSIPSG